MATRTSCFFFFSCQQLLMPPWIPLCSCNAFLQPASGQVRNPGLHLSSISIRCIYTMWHLCHALKGFLSRTVHVLHTGRLTAECAQMGKRLGSFPFFPSFNQIWAAAAAQLADQEFNPQLCHTLNSPWERLKPTLTLRCDCRDKELHIVSSMQICMHTVRKYFENSHNTKDLIKSLSV